MVGPMLQIEGEIVRGRHGRPDAAEEPRYVRVEMERHEVSQVFADKP